MGILNEDWGLPKKLLKTRFALGWLERSSNGTTGRGAFFSIRTRNADVMQKRTRDEITAGCVHEKMFPPRFNPRIKKVTVTVNVKDPAMSKVLRVSRYVLYSVFDKLGPMSLGVVATARTR